ncbi:hypothetical protein F511_30216 [Dorcoceras hygrometricum]|uniref:Uncharacterized protein n=1 Tax=Dorcoceras hygrometricum TaxID=472368 RepID=A0A2Z7A896_9LAMI|nr:hypothetical protein F511_30216 [Dorcoceras hygrometricum]
MFLTRIFWRSLYAAAETEASATAAAASSKVPDNPLEEFFEADRNPEDDKPVVYGTDWQRCFCLFLVGYFSCVCRGLLSIFFI